MIREMARCLEENWQSTDVSSRVQFWAEMPARGEAGQE